MTTHNTTATTELFTQCKELATAFCDHERDAVHMAELACKIATVRDFAPCVAVDYARSQTIAREGCRGDLARCAISCYVGTYAKYNEGSLDGVWMGLDGYEDAEYLLECMRGMHEDEADPELMLQDWNIGLDGLTASDLGECPGTDTLQFLLDLLQADEDERELALDYLQATGGSLSHYSDFSDLLRTAEDLRVGSLDPHSWNPFRDYVEETFMELYGHEIPDSLTGYIDFDRMARDWGFEHTIGEKYVFMH